MKNLARTLVLLVCGFLIGLPLIADSSVSNRTCTVDGLYVFTPENLRMLGLHLSEAQQGRIGELAAKADGELARRNALRVEALEKKILGVLSPAQRRQLTDGLIKEWDAGIAGDLGVALNDRQKARVLRSVAAFVESTKNRGMVYPEAVRALRQGALSALTPEQQRQYQRKERSLPPELASIVPFLEKTGSFTLSDAQKASIRRYMAAEAEEMRLVGATEGGLIVRNTRHDVCRVLTPDQRKRLTDARARQYYEILRLRKPAGMSTKDVMQAAQRQAETYTCGPL